MQQTLKHCVSHKWSQNVRVDSGGKTPAGGLKWGNQTDNLISANIWSFSQTEQLSHCC